jgi:riboflavin kinase/FMN adenylyltransferase
MVTTGGVFAAIGNFDGVHRGHQRLIARTVAFARDRRGDAGAVVFDPHPRRHFLPDAPPFLITTPAKRDALLAEAGASAVFTVPFDSRTAAMSPKSFVYDVLKARLSLAGVAAGADFRFGRARAGDASALKALAVDAGLECLIIDPRPETDGGEKIGSSRIRQGIAEGDVREVARMLGRRWSVEGLVAEGRKLGRAIGFPTANLPLGELIEPRRGVYAVEVRVDRAVYAGVANFGLRPTVAGPSVPLLEAHLFDFDGDLYGLAIEVFFVDFIRDERKFDGLDALKAQIAADARSARRILEMNR